MVVVSEAVKRSDPSITGSFALIPPDADLGCATSNSSRRNGNMISAILAIRLKNSCFTSVNPAGLTENS